jgi:hypothetical protein
MRKTADLLVDALTFALPFCHSTFSGKKPLSGYPRELKTLGDHIKRRRLDLSLSLKQVAVGLAVTDETVRNWEQDQATGPQLSSDSPFPRLLTVAHSCYARRATSRLPA